MLNMLWECVTNTAHRNVCSLFECKITVKHEFQQQVPAVWKSETNGLSYGHINVKLFKNSWYKDKKIMFSYLIWINIAFYYYLDVSFDEFLCVMRIAYLLSVF